MKRSLLFASLIIPVLLLLLACNPLQPERIPYLSAEDHAIITAILDSTRSHSDSIRVCEITGTYIDLANIRLGLLHDAVIYDTSVLSGYEEANRTVYMLNEDYLPDNVVLSVPDTSEMYSGLLNFTRPGYSDDGMTAIVEYSAVYAPLAGFGDFALLQKIGGVWRIIKLMGIWIS